MNSSNKQHHSGLKIRQKTVREHGYEYDTFEVEGKDADGKRLRRRFKDRREAEAFRATEEVRLLNLTSALNNVVTRLDERQVREAEDAFQRLGDHYSLREAVEFFLSHSREPDFQISLRVARRKFLDGKEREGVRERSIVQLESTIKRFGKFMDNCLLHEVGEQDVERFLKSLRARDGVQAASRKTWNNYRADLSSFFNWCCDTQRRWLNGNPAQGVRKFRKLDRELPEILTIKQTLKLLRDVEGYRDGAMVRYFALALFAGLRTGPEGELHKLARHPDRDRLIDLKRGVIHVPSEIAKTRSKRQIEIRENLRLWLEHSDPEILPTGHDRMIREIRKDHELLHDQLRHSFFSYHVAAFRSVGDASLEGGNTEAVVRKHYLNLATKKEGLAFWRIAPKGESVANAAPSNVIPLAS
ncbi:phage integrase N-terminal SAM-like domain-containing protein [Verrucomicrobiales bacterium]|nr:phage integrase N-terminal SAM-like domain-containing protein [Verrucomicrobiales bacterium]